MLLHTWLDRPLSLAGRVIIKQDDVLKTVFWQGKKAIGQIPNLAIHLRPDRNPITWDTDTTFRPIIATEAVSNLYNPTTEEKEESKDEKPKLNKNPFATGLVDRHWTSLLNFIAEDITNDSRPTPEEDPTMTITKDDIVDFDLAFFDVTPGEFVGVHEEFISSPRLDNMFGTTVATHAFAEVAQNPPADSSVSILFSYDVEEVGSTAYMGAAGTFTEDIIQRIYYAFAEPDPETALKNDSVEKYKTCIKKSMFLSADNGHALHPNYVDVMSEKHRPMLQGGIILAISPDQNFTTDSESASIIKTLCNNVGTPFQEFISKPGTRSGSTIGPSISAKLGMKTIDVGGCQLAMHSIKEFAAVADTLYYKNFLMEFFRSFATARGDLLKE